MACCVLRCGMRVTCVFFVKSNRNYSTLCIGLFTLDGQISYASLSDKISMHVSSLISTN